MLPHMIFSIAGYMTQHKEDTTRDVQLEEHDKLVVHKMNNIPEDESAAVPVYLISEDDRRLMRHFEDLLSSLSLAVHAVEREYAELKERIEGKHE